MHRGPPCHLRLLRCGGHLQTRTSEDRCLFAVNLDAVSRRLANEYPVVIVDSDASRSPEILLPFQTLGALALSPHFRISVQLVFPPLGDGRVSGLGGEIGTVDIKDL